MCDHLKVLGIVLFAVLLAVGFIWPSIIPRIEFAALVIFFFGGMAFIAKCVNNAD